MTTLLAQTIKQLKAMSDSSLISIYNEYASNNSYETIFDNDDDNINTFFDCPHEAVKSAFYGDYNPSHYYFIFNGYGNLASFSYTTDDNCPIDFSELAQWVIDNDLFSEYDIEVITLDDMLASIEDNITDDENMLYKLCDYLVISYKEGDDIENLISDCMYKIDGYCYESLQDIITLLGINYE